MNFAVVNTEIPQFIQGVNERHRVYNVSRNHLELERGPCPATPP